MDQTIEMALIEQGFELLPGQKDDIANLTTERSKWLEEQRVAQERMRGN